MKQAPRAAGSGHPHSRQTRLFATCVVVVLLLQRSFEGRSAFSSSSSFQSRTPQPCARANLVSSGWVSSRSPGRPRARLVPRVSPQSEIGKSVGHPARDENFSQTLPAQAALFLTYFGMQSGLSFYMKWLLSKVMVTRDLFGVPASFLVTALQQLTGVALLIALFAVTWIAGRPYKPKVLKSRKEWLLLFGLSLSFMLNIGLNLLSFSLVPLSVTMVIRGCSPLSTAFMQSIVMKRGQDISAAEWACMVFGVLCATAMVIVQSGGLAGAANSAFFFGIAMSVISLFSGAFDFVFKGVLGSDVKLNALDTNCYMALPVALFTSILAGTVVKPVSASWATQVAPFMTDWAVFRKVLALNPKIFMWVILSGVLAFLYNIFVTFLVVKLSPATTAFAGNFNKAATILLSLLLLEGQLPTDVKGKVILAAVFGNIAAFTLYNVLKNRRNLTKS